MFNFVMAASFKDIIETNEVALDISIGISNTISYTCLGSEVYNDSNLVIGENLFYSFLISD